MLKFILYPFAVLYDGVTRIRNYMYDRGLKPSMGFDLPVISVGNLSVGGTGKTPMIEYLIRLLTPEHKVGVLSRGYGRKSRGFIVARGDEDASDIGDEPLQYFKKFRDRIQVAVGEERALSIPLMLQEDEDTDVILLDDAFQHRRIRPSFQILLTSYQKPFFSDMLLPAGRLRESATGAVRADLVVVSKCPAELGDQELMDIEKQIRDFTTRPVFFSTISYGAVVPFENTTVPLGEDVILVTGIADPRTIVDHVRKHYRLKEHISFPDHHRYAASDIDLIIQSRKGRDCSVLTTEKDMVKLDVPAFGRYLERIPFFYIPITVQFLKQQGEFDEIIKAHVAEVYKKTSESGSEAS